MVPPCAAHDSEPGDEEDDWMILPPDESLEEFEVDDNQEWTGENATTMSLEPTPEDHKNYEANLSTLVVEEEKKDDDFDFDLSEVTEDEDDGGIPDFF